MEQEAVKEEKLEIPNTSEIAKEILRKCGSTTFQLGGATYTIVASPPDKAVSGTDSKALETPRHRCSSSPSSCAPVSTPGSHNGQLSKQGSLTIVRRSSTKMSSAGKYLKRGPSMTNADDEFLDSVDLTTDNLPAVDTPDACEKAALRLCRLLRQLQQGEIPADLLQKNLRYAARVLESVYIDRTKEQQNQLQQVSEQENTIIQCEQSNTTNSNNDQRGRLKTPIWARRLADEDDELSEVQPDAVPQEVREWLASTFTRQLATCRKRSDEKPKFKSVAHAIRAGIFVDRIYRKVTASTLMHYPPNVATILKTLDDWSFNVFDLNDAALNQPLKYLGYELLSRYGIFHKFKVPPANLENFLIRIEEGYNRSKNPYHNNLHAADVAQSIHYMLFQTGLMAWLTDLEIFATLIAAIIHDYEHTGTTNNFHVMSGSETALLYNDRAVLENHHVSAAFRLMKEGECNILLHLSREEFREFRALVIDMVLATDMSYHFQQLKNMKNTLALQESIIDKSKVLSLVLHCCDISHPAKKWDLHRQWTSRLLEEFFQQGDKERDLGLPFSPLCDRNNTLVAESQIGFIEFIVEPSMSVCGDMLEAITTALTVQTTQTDIQTNVVEDPQIANCTAALKKLKIKKPWVDCLAENKKKWKEQAHTEAEASKVQENEEIQSEDVSNEQQS